MNYTLKKIKGEIRMISGCQDSQCSSDVQDISNFDLPNPAGKSGGAVTCALLEVLYNTQDFCDNELSFHSVLLQTREILQEGSYSQIPQLTSSKPLDIDSPFNIVPEYCKGKRSALIIGINYVGQEGELKGCHNDAKNVQSYIVKKHGFLEENITLLMDDGMNLEPNKENIVMSMSKLVAGSKKGDALFFHYSGHGGKIKDINGDENDGYDETLIPLDFKSSGQINDNDIYKLLIDVIPDGVVLTCLMDCCHSGTVLDLPYVFKIDGKSLQINEKYKMCVPETGYERELKTVAAEIHMFSGCKDDQTSVDVSDVGPYELPNPAGKAGGVCTSALLKVLYSEKKNSGSNLSFQDVILRMRKILQENNVSQVPQLTSSRPLDIKKPFYIVPENFNGTRRAVIIGINYTGQNGELSGCQNDAMNMKDYLMNYHGFKEENITTLLDDNLNQEPTKKNILNAFKDLAAISVEADACFVHYSGHGGSIKDADNDENDGYDETLIPVDFMTSGHIIDDEIFNTLIIKMPKAVNLTCVIDSCHSGTALDLPYMFKASADSDVFVDKMKLQPQFDQDNTRDVVKAMVKDLFATFTDNGCSLGCNKLDEEEPSIHCFDDLDDVRDEMLSSQLQLDESNAAVRDVMDTTFENKVNSMRVSDDQFETNDADADVQYMSNNVNCMDVKELWNEIRCDIWGNSLSRQTRPNTIFFV